MPAANSATQIQIDAGTPNHTAVPGYIMDSGRLKNVWPPEMPVSSPRRTISMPSVTMKPCRPKRTISTALAIPITLLVGALIGIANAALIVRFGLHGFIVTLGMLIVLRGLLTGISGGQTFFNLPESMMYLGTAVWLGVPASIWICVALFAAGIVLLGYTGFGRSLYAIGGNVDAAKAAGIRTDRVLWIALVGASVLAALGGLLLSGRLASVAASQGNGAIFTVFAAAVIGGVSLNGGKGTMFGAFTGILLLFMIQNVLTLAGVPAQWIGALNGAIILIALVVSRITGGKAQE